MLDSISSRTHRPVLVFQGGGYEVCFYEWNAILFTRGAAPKPEAVQPCVSGRAGKRVLEAAHHGLRSAVNAAHLEGDWHLCTTQASRVKLDEEFDKGFVRAACKAAGRDCHCDRCKRWFDPDEIVHTGYRGNGGIGVQFDDNHCLECADERHEEYCAKEIWKYGSLEERVKAIQRYNDEHGRELSLFAAAGTWPQLASTTTPADLITIEALAGSPFRAAPTAGKSMSTSSKEIHVRLSEAHGARVLILLVARSARDLDDWVLGELGTPTKGIYFVVRLPHEWTMYSYRFDELPELDHLALWEDFVCPWLAQHWCQPLEMPPTRLENRLKPFADAIPRGRVAPAPGKATFHVHHGGDVVPFMGVSNATVERLFNVNGVARWVRDKHERCRAGNRDAVRELLRLGPEEKWGEVSF